MSIIERTNPLNLQYRICIVTSASSPLGVIICKTLLKANAFVLGVDSRPKHQSLNAGLGTHFQFLQSDASDAKTAEEIIAAAKLKFDGKERIDALVNLVGDDHGGQRVSARLSKLAGQVMASAGTGSIIYVADGDGDQRARLARAKSGNGVRCNVIHRGRDDALGAPLLAYEEAKTHMTALMRTERLTTDLPSASEGTKQAAGSMYDVGNLTLFLAGNMSQDVKGKILHSDGSEHQL